MTTPAEPTDRATPAADPDFTAVIDAGGVVRHQSPSAERLLGYGPGELVGTAYLDLVHPDDRPRADAAFRALLKRPGAVGPLVNLRCRHRDGSWRPLEGTGENLLAGPAAGVVLTVRDGSWRQAEARLRLLESVVVHANDAVLITDAEPIADPVGPRIVYVNAAFTRMTGYALDDVLGKTPRILQGPGTARGPRDKIRTALERWRPVRVELLNYRKDGTPFWVELSIVPVTDDRGWYVNWVSIQRDIGGQKRVEADLQAARDEAEAANRAKSEFLSRMSHELRTPLNGILGFSQILQLEPLAAPHREIVDDLYAAGRRLLALINEVLDISRVESGDLPLSIEPVPLPEVVRETLTLVAPLAAGRGVWCRSDLPADPLTYVRADRQRLGQVFLNLFSNGIKYNRPGGSLVVSAGPAPGGRVRVRVADTGPGIPADKLGRLFTPFDRLGAEATGVEGTGLGLALSRRLVEAMGGVMGADSTPGAGATFWFELAAADAPAAPPPAGAGPGVPGRPPPGDHTVLYVEDNLANVRVIELILAHRPGVKLLAAMLGGLGLDLAAQHRPDLILLDLHLPDMTGAEVLRRLKADPATRAIPVVVLSADATASQLVRVRGAGAQEYLTKPLDVGEFLRVLDDALAPARPGGGGP